MKLILKREYTYLNTLSIDFNSSCNNLCINCPRCYRFINENNKDELELNEAIALLDYVIKTYNINNIEIGQLAEFSLYKFSYEILEYLATKYTGQVNLVTNCSGFSRKFIDKLDNLDLKNVYFIISIWGSNREEYKELMGANNFDIVYNNILQLANKKNINLLLTVVNYSKKQITNMINFGKKIAESSNRTFIIDNLERHHEKHSLSMYINTFMNYSTDINYVKQQEHLFNHNLNFDCTEFNVNSIFISAHRIYPCFGTSYNIKWKDISDIRNIVSKLRVNIKKYPECDRCTVGHACLRVGRSNDEIITEGL